MGTVASIRTDVPIPVGVRRRIEATFDEYDQLFSLYRRNSPGSRLARGETTPDAAGPVVAAAFERSIRWRAATHGAFTPYASDGSIDLMGIAKAVAMEEVELLLAAELPGWVLNVGGDVSWRVTDPGATTSIGVADPADPDSLLCTVPLDAGWTAAATSGTSERGEHVRRIDDRKEFRQATVLAADVVTADVLSTGVLAGGQDVLLEAAARPGVDVIAVTMTGDLVFTDGVADCVMTARAGRRAAG
jgi:thiamine biosynthesis lipoprotein